VKRMSAAALALLACSSSSGSGERPGLRPPTSAEVAAVPMTRESRELLDELATFRELSAKGGVASVELSRSELMRLLQQIAAEELPRGQLKKEGEALRGLGLIPFSLNWEELLLVELTRVVQGLYSPRHKQLFIVDDLERDARAEVLAHEFVHALQDQHFDLQPLMAYAPGQSDRQQARSHLVEGDAVFTLAKRSQAAARREVARERAQPASGEPAPNNVPRFLTNSLMSPYVVGKRFVEALFAEHGFKGVDRAFRELPESTEQVLHFSKYQSRERALSVTVPVSPALGVTWANQDTFGELSLRLMLSEFIVEQDAKEAAAGWGGDQLVLANMTLAGKEFAAVALVLAMDSSAEAAELATKVEAAFPGGCIDREQGGPLVFVRDGERAGFAAGPYETVSGRSQATCSTVEAWLLQAVATATVK